MTCVGELGSAASYLGVRFRNPVFRFIYGLFNDAVAITDCIASNNSMTTFREWAALEGNLVNMAIFTEWEV
jgi:hypothetical protein